MEHFTFPAKLFAGIAITASLIVSGCHNNDTNTTSDTISTADTSHPVVTDTANTMRKDSGAPAPSVTDTAMKAKTGTAKPNSAKKGLKGKASITLPSKMTGPMTPDASGTYANVDYIPSFPGGNKGLQQFFDDNLTYPEDASNNGVEGTVNISFTIDETGKLLSPVVDGAQEGYGLDEEALRVVNKMPKWNPGKIKGKPVRTKFILPVRFVLN